VSVLEEEDRVVGCPVEKEKEDSVIAITHL